MGWRANAAGIEAGMSEHAGPVSAPLSERWERYSARHAGQFRQVTTALVGVRVALAAGCMVSLALQPEGSPGLSAPIILTLAAIFALGAAMLAALRTRWDLDRVMVGVLVADLLLHSSLNYFAGGVLNTSVALLHFASIATAALLVSERAALFYASASSVSLAVTVVLYYLAATKGVPIWGVPAGLLSQVESGWGSIVGNLVKLAVAAHLIALLSSALPYRVSGVRLLYEELLGEIVEGVVAIDNAGRIAYVNKEALRLFRWQGIPRIVGELFPEALRRDEDRQILEILTAGASLHGEVDLDTERGRLPVEVRTSVLRDSHGRLRGVVGVFSDLTSKRRMALAQKRLERLRSFEEMALGIAHEIRNPMASIRGAMQELRRRTFTEGDEQLLADIVLRESDRLDKILDEFMSYARMKPLELRPTNLVALADEVKTLLSYRDDACALALEAEREVLELAVDRDKIKQVLINLGVNALQASAGTGRVTLKVAQGELQRRSDGARGAVFERIPAVELSVLDDGPGVPEADRAKLFTPFFSTKSQGTGLGLPLAQKIVDAHGGDIHYDVRPEGGSQFRVLLPAPAADSEEGSWPR